MTVLVIDYGMGNLASVARALEDCGARVEVSDTPASLKTAERAVLPGVGAFPDAMHRLNDAGWVEPLKQAVLAEGIPLLGICLGMQLLADDGEEVQPCQGLGLIPGSVRRIVPAQNERLPHVGWNEVRFTKSAPLFEGIPDGSDFYFVHTYHFACTQAADIAGTTPFGPGVVSAISRGHVMGTQFHPEKSSSLGRKLLSNFLGVPRG